jgi:hypothetical protein
VSTGCFEGPTIVQLYNTSGDVQSLVAIDNDSYHQCLIENPLAGQGIRFDLTSDSEIDACFQSLRNIGAACLSP